MNEALKSKEVLAMYDVRGIQSYIFKSNKLQEIIGASNLVENIIVDGIREIVRNHPDWNQAEFLTDWQSDSYVAFLEDANCKMQVLFIGGGNAYVLFRTGDLCSQVNKELAKYVLDHTYSLNLAVAVVEKTNDYMADYENINNEMRDIKAKMPATKPVGVMPFMAADSITGYPLATYKGQSAKNYDGQKEYLCTESWLKREHLSKEENPEKILDNMVTGKGDNSTLALVHIDGNNMGKRLKVIMEKIDDYGRAIETMRQISINIQTSFSACFEKAKEYVDGVSDQIRKNRKGKLIRKIILAGDDITFICNAQAAIGAVEAFLKETVEHVLYVDRKLSEEDNYKEYGLSACAGIAYFNSHFPFSDAYRVAESCCSSAKKRAKDEKNKVGDNMGCFFDYQICTHIKAENLESYRTAHYFVSDGETTIITRPYYVSAQRVHDLNEKNETYDSSNLNRNIKYCKDENKIPRSQAKALRNAFAEGKDAVKAYKTFLESRGRKIKEEDWPYMYDALEIMDISLGEEE